MSSSNDALELRMQRAAQNQALCREVNRRITTLSERFALAIGEREFICECAHPSCTELVPMTVAEYEEIRADSTTFFVRPSDEHVDPAVEEVVRRTDRYWILRKIGVGAEVAEALDSLDGA